MVFETKYKPHVRFIRTALLKNWDIIANNSILKHIFPNKPMIAYKRETNLRDSLVRAKLDTQRDLNDLESLLKILRQDKDSGL